MSYSEGPPIAPINPRKIDMPADPAVKASYLALGWVELRGVFEGSPYLKWPFDLCSPMHPGEKPDPPYVPPPLLPQLPLKLIEIAKTGLPWADRSEAEEIQVQVLVTVKFKRKYTGSKRRAGPSYSWIPDSAEMARLGGEP